MSATTPHIAAAVTSTLAPFIPVLLAGESEATLPAEQIIASQLWDRIRGLRGVLAAAQRLAQAPHDETYQTTLAKTLGEQLNRNLPMARELLAMLGGLSAVDAVLDARESWVDRVTQILDQNQTREVMVVDDSDDLG